MNLRALHPRDRDVFPRLASLAKDFASRFYISRSLEVEPVALKDLEKYYGFAQYPSRIEIAVRGRKGRRWARARYSDFVITDTVVHELAHLLDEDGHEHNETFSSNFVSIWRDAEKFSLHRKVKRCLDGHKLL